MQIDVSPTRIYDGLHFGGWLLLTGRVISHFTVSEKLGAGGMGEVYRARDSRLGREVALKVLPEAFALDPDRMARFEREAHLLASLNHPNIAAIYGIEDAEGVRCLVLELVEGETLLERIRRGPLAMEEVLDIARQVAEALESAHERGIVHRDLKPGNIKVTPAGTVKVLDFGLAKMFESEAAITDLSRSPTLTTPATRLGVVMGTAAYMSPEQARGREVDKRTDIFAFGCVLFEMLAGRQAFSGETVSDTMASILKLDPEWSRLPDSTPPALLRLLRRCLEKDPKLRLRDIGEARIALADPSAAASEAPAASVPAAPVSTLRSRALWLATAVVLAAASAFVAWTLKPVASPPLRKFEIVIEGSSLPFPPAISPDGRVIAYVAESQLWVRELDKLEPRAIPGTAGATHPFWSPDSAFLGYLLEGKLWKVPVSGGGATAIANVGVEFTGGAGAFWGEDGTILYSRGNTGLFSVSDRGGDPRIFVPLAADENDIHEPFVLPGGKGILAVLHRANSPPDTLALITGNQRTVLVQFKGDPLWQPSYSPTGHILFSRTGVNSGVWALPFSLASLKATGDPFLVLSGATFPSLSREGTLTCIGGGSTGLEELVWVSMDGKTQAVGNQTQIYLGLPRVSPDGTRVAAVARVNQNVDVWIFDLKRNTRTRLTFDPAPDTVPVWSPQGDRVFYVNVNHGLAVKAADGTGSAQYLGEGDDPSISGDGKYLAFTRDGKDTATDIWYMPLSGDRQPVSLLATPAREFQPQLSPDGRYLAYVSDESGATQVYLTRFPSGEGKWQVSASSGAIPRWSPKGDKLFYRSGARQMTEVSVSTLGNAPSLGAPRVLFSADTAGVQFEGPFQFDVSPDGRRFLMVREASQAAKRIAITVVQNWFTEFKDRK
ncbi:MAG TPA: protein kinase [Terriglobales bacterium]|nr:protein kinase [Terriglobales bacterium]